MFTNFTNSQKDLFWAVIDNLPINFNDANEKEIEYLIMNIDEGSRLTRTMVETLRRSTLLLRLLKEVKSWKGESHSEDGESEEYKNKRDELVELLINADKRKNNTR